ncbi:MAG TPA: M56 family metallopeptidase, partial [Bryobacteraceae bacterium]|nr:M56 family metallopeptidase [Bryobacteraceae bacterium]
MTAAMENHLWQSTVFAVAAWLVARALKENRARVRHAVWMTASVKFLVPFSVLVMLGSRIEWRRETVVAAPANYAVVMDQVSAPFATLTPLPAAVPHREIPWEGIALAIWACGVLGISISWLIRWTRIRVAVQAGRRIDLHLAIRAVSSPTAIEPGVFGIWRPVLMLPEGISDRLTESQLNAVIEHELCHVRHRDNLIAAMQMAIETVFWFHPLVWWIGKQMIAERERACDEAVLARGNAPQTYAEAILNVCKLYVESPLECVAGVTGARLKDRIQAIVSGRVARELGIVKKIALAAAGVAAMIVPVAIGVMNSPSLHAQARAPETEVKDVPKWEVVAIKPCEPSSGPQGRSGNGNGRGPGRLTVPCQTPLRLIEQAYETFADGRRLSFQRNPIEGAPAWASTDRYTIEAKAETPAGRTMMQGPMMQKILEERFKLKIRRETRELPVYNLTVAKGGPKNLKPSTPDSCIPLDFEKGPPPPGPDVELCEMIGRGVAKNATEGQFSGFGFTMARFTEQLGALLDRPVIDKTGLDGKYDFKVPIPLEDLSPPQLDPRPERPFANYRDDEMIRSGVRQLGLRLEPAKGPGVVYVIESIERPSDNFTPPRAEEKPAPRFEVASIKPCGNEPGQAIAGSGVTSPG